jgi:hypothetical protein
MKRSLDTAPFPALVAVVLSGAACFACQTQPDRNLGDSLDARSLDLAPPPEPTEPFGVSPLEFVGRWVGVAEAPLAMGGVREAYAFPSGSTQFSLEIVASGAPDQAFLHGSSLVFGSGAPPPPLDPASGYPSDVDYADIAYFDRNIVMAAGHLGPLPPYEGHPYPVRELVLSNDFNTDEAGLLIADGVLNLEFDTNELFAPWCALQTPQPTGRGEWKCVKGNSYGQSDVGECNVGFSNLSPEQEAEVLESGASLLREAVDCNKLFLCKIEVCKCTDSACADDVATRRGTRGKLVVRRDGDTLTGVFSNAVFMNERQLPVPLGTVRFTRSVEE